MSTAKFNQTDILKRVNKLGITVHPDERRRAKEQFDSSFLLRLGVTFMVGVLFMAACGGDADISDTASASIAGPAPALASIAGPPPIPTLTPTIAAPELMANPVSLSSSYWLGWAGTDCASYGKKPLALCRAMKDAEIAEPDEVSTGLTAITPHNPDLIWSAIPGQSRVLTVTWSSFVDRTPPESVYDPRNGYRAGKTMMSTRDVFVTIVPELREFCLTAAPLMTGG
jgi:hypothetical protein